MVPAVLSALALLASIGYPVYDEMVNQPRAARAERRTRRSEATTRALEEFLMQDEERRAQEITRSLGAQREREVIEGVMQRQLQDPTGLGMTQAELGRVQQLAYRPRPSPTEVLAYFGVSG